MVVGGSYCTGAAARLTDDRPTTQVGEGFTAAADAVDDSAVYGGSVQFRSLVARHGGDSLVVALAAAAQAEAWIDPGETSRVITAPASLLWTLPLLLRRRLPLGAPAMVFAALAAESFVPGHAVVQSQTNIVAILAAFWIVGTHPQTRAALAGAAIGYATMAAVFLNDFTNVASVFLMFTIATAAWALGRALGERARQTAHLEERANRLEQAHEAAVAEERARIARELHDIIAHSVSVMTVQAGAARLLLDDDPNAAREPLLSVEHTGRQALADMRRLLGILRSGDERMALAPQPGLADVAALVEQVRSAGLAAELTLEGEPKPLPPGVDVTVYRLVQEALTNALKHAAPAHAHVRVRYRSECLELEVTNDGAVTTSARDGHGLVGMRERVALYGGTLFAGRVDGSYEVRAELPLSPSEP